MNADIPDQGQFVWNMDPDKKAYKMYNFKKPVVKNG